MSTLKMIATVAYIIICIALVIVVLMQEGKTSGLGALSGAADSYWSKNKGPRSECLLKSPEYLPYYLLYYRQFFVLHGQTKKDLFVNQAYDNKVRHFLTAV